MGKTLTSKAPERANGAGLDPARYGRLCAKILPKVIESDEEFDRMVEHLERLTFKQAASAEEKVLAELLHASSRPMTTSTTQCRRSHRMRWSST
jgi:hypothetical protein